MLAQQIAIEPDHDQQYADYLDRLARDFATIASEEPLFMTDANLWELYLGAFPESVLQYHNCNTCRHFIERFGGLVTIDESGKTRSALWRVKPTDELSASVAAMLKAVERAQVTGVFLSDVASLGVRACGMRDKSQPPTSGNTWNHLAVTLPPAKVHRQRVETAWQAMAAKLEDVKNVRRALDEFPVQLLSQAAELLETDAFYRSEKVDGPVKWLRDLKQRVESTKHERYRENIITRTVALAPAGFCHPRSSMAGTLLEDLATGNGFEWAAARFKAKMHPLRYQRPQAAPTSGAIEAAEKLVEKLGIARSLERRFARLDEIETIWRQAQTETRKSGGVFSHLSPEAPVVKSLHVPGKTMTWEKFASTVLPTAISLEVRAPQFGNYCAYLTAEHDDAPPILQWDRDDQRNRVSLCVYHRGSYASQWGVGSGWVKVTAVSLCPHQWLGEKMANHADGALLVIPGCVDSKTAQGNALFPETLKSELHGCRSVIEAYSQMAEIGGREHASACGLLLRASMQPINVRVTSEMGAVTEHTIDRFD